MPARSPTHPLEAHLGYWLRLVSNQVSGTFARALQDRQVSVAEWVALNLITQTEDLTPATLADSMGMTRGAITKVLDKLEAKDWATRTPHADDNRVQRLSLTRRGQRALPELTAIADTNDVHFFAPLSTREQATLRTLLAKLANAHHIGSLPTD